VGGGFSVLVFLIAVAFGVRLHLGFEIGEFDLRCVVVEVILELARVL
jgi:hypothetical protein